MVLLLCLVIFDMNIEKIEFKEACFAYGQDSEILSNLSLTIFKGETIVVFGKSGGGKTTFLKLTEGLIAPIDGDVIINDKLSLKKASKAELMKYHSHSAFIFQDSGLLNNMNAYDNLALFLRYSTNKKEKEIKDIIVPVMQELSIMEHQNSLPGQLSRAEKKMISIARAMIINPEMYIYDFPFEGLDYFYINKIKNIIFEQKKKRRTLLISDNHLDFALEIADKVLVLYEGKLLFFDSPDKLLQTEHPFIKELLEHKRL